MVANIRYEAFKSNHWCNSKGNLFTLKLRRIKNYGSLTTHDSITVTFNNNYKDGNTAYVICRSSIKSINIMCRL